MKKKSTVESMNQEDPRSDLFFFWWEAPNHIQLPSLWNINDSRHISQKKKKKIPHTCQTSTISKKKTPHLSNIRDLKKILHTCQTFVISKKPTPNKHPRSTVKKKKYPTPNKHPRSQKNTLHLSNIRDLKKILHTCQTFVISKKPTPNKHPRSTVKKKYPTPNKHPRSQIIFT